jgi:hypothetical protein
LLGNHQQSHQLAAVDQADQADQAVVDHKVDPVDLAAVPALARDSSFKTNRISNSDILPLFFGYGEMRNSNE